VEYQLGRCKAPCVGWIDRERYGRLVEEAELLLEGRNRELARRIRGRMDEASEALRFEEAARLRDAMRTLERLAEKQAADAPGSEDRDVFGVHREGELAAVALLPVREGRLQDARAFSFRSVVEDDGELLGRLISQLYSTTLPPPPEILVPLDVDGAETRAELLGELAGRRVKILRPQRGDGRRLLEIARSNAQVRFDAAHSKKERSERALIGLQRALRLPDLPKKIECYDNSNIQGTDPVGAMVCFRDGKPDKGAYRIFKIKTVVGADDYATMKEVLGRRFARGLAGEAGWELPDLVLIDGGRGQLSMVEAVCRELGVAVRLASLAKPREGEETDKVYEPGRVNPVPLRAHDPALLLLQALRDEAHRFGVKHHRGQRKRRTLRSELLEIPGVGVALARRLLREFGSLEGVRAASVDALAAVDGLGEKRARAVVAALRARPA
jgi:excinuclease ABC subunit C